MGEVLDTPFFPKDIKTFSVSLYHNEEQYVSISLKISKPFQMCMFGNGGGEYNLSSSDSGKILKIEQDLKNLFFESKLTYQQILYPWSYFSHIVIFLLSIVFVICLSYLAYKVWHPKISVNLVWPTYLIAATVYYLFSEFLVWVFPFYSYELTKNKTKRNIFRAILGLIITAVIITVIINLVT